MTDSTMTEIPGRWLDAAEQLIEPYDGDTGGARVRGAGALREAAAMLKAAVEALEPFAAVAAKLNPELPDDTPVTLSLGGGAIYVYALSRFRKARNALASLKQPGGS